MKRSDDITISGLRTANDMTISEGKILEEDMKSKANRCDVVNYPTNGNTSDDLDSSYKLTDVTDILESENDDDDLYEPSQKIKRIPHLALPNKRIMK